MSEQDKITWNIINKYFEDNKNFIVKHHLNSYNDFIQNGIPRIFRDSNPIKIMKEQDEVEIKSGVENTFLYAQGMGVDLGYHAIGDSFSLNLPDIVKKVEDADSVTEDTFIDVTKGLERPCSWLDIRNHGKFWPGICILLCIQLSLTTFSELNNLQNKDKCAEMPTVSTNSFKLRARYLARIISA